ncbi:MAG: hypothetical protein ACRDFS_02265 [Chloroflexota bacterium]
MERDTVIPERVEATAAPAIGGSEVRTFLIADVRGYTRFTVEHGDEAAAALATRFADLVSEAGISSRWWSAVPAKSAYRM